MNRLFEALGEMEMNLPSPKEVPRGGSSHVVIQLGAPAMVLAPPIPALEDDTDQFCPEIAAQDVTATDVDRWVSAQDAETEMLSSETAPQDDSLFAVTPPIPAQETETEMLSSETAPQDDPLFAVTPPIPAQETETEVLLSETVSQDNSLSLVTPSIPTQEAVPQEISPKDMALADSPDKQLVPPKPAQEGADAMQSQSKSTEPASGRRVAINVPSESRLVALTNPNSLGAEKFRALVTRLEHLHKQSELKSFQVTSSIIHEGKTLVSGNVAVTLAKHIGSKTLLIEGDLHRPTLGTIFGLNRMRGVSHWWSGCDEDLGQFIYRLGDLPLWFLSAGRPCDRSSDILRSDRFVKAFGQLASRFEWVVVDSTPILPIVDVNLWSRLVDGTLLVVREGVTPAKALQQGLHALDHPNLIGVVLNEAVATNEAKYAGEYYDSPKIM